VDSILEVPDLSTTERELLMGGTLRKIFRWNPTSGLATNAQFDHGGILTS